MEKGIFAFYKAPGISSYDVIRKLQLLFPAERIGHGGAIDFLAEGVLVIAIGKEFTKQLQPILKNTKKEYIAEITLGYNSATDDSEGPLEEVNTQLRPSLQEMRTTLSQFIGETEQVPPVYSAVKIKGQPAYRRSRRGEKLTLVAKKVTIYSIDLIEYNFPVVKIKVVSGSGVYIRSLARSIGINLKTGGYLKSLIRTAVGDFKLEQCIRL